jgi:protoporphyrinogen oxidase
MTKKIIIIGGGPAGMVAGYEAVKNGLKPTVLDDHPDSWGGIARTMNYKGYLFDIGPHRFFSKSREILDFWDEVLKDDLVIRNRLSRLYYNGKFYYYPLKVTNALFNLGVFTSFVAFLSYVKSRLFPIKEPKLFEDWVSNQFGKILYETFFRSYTEKVWGISCKELSADWAAQRIKGLSLSNAIKNALFPNLGKKKDKVIKTLTSTFFFPKKGAGQMWTRCAELIEKKGGNCYLGASVFKIEHDNCIITRCYARTKDGDKCYNVDELIASMPIKNLINAMSPKPPENVLVAANDLKYRDYLIVILLVNAKGLFDDNWIYIHDPSVKLGRVPNFNNWGSDMIYDQNHTCLGLEYFCFEGDDLWNSTDEKLIELGKKEISKIKLANASDVFDGHVVRQPKAYPVYDDHYKKNLEIIREYLGKFENIQLVGRNGTHRYNNMDHSMMTGMLASRNIVKGKRIYDPWMINVDAQYHEEVGQEDMSMKKSYVLKLL